MISQELLELFADMQNHQTLDGSGVFRKDNQSVGWYATRKAEKWNNENDYNSLLQFIENKETNDKDKHNAFVVLISLIANCNLSISPVFNLLQNIKNEEILKWALYRINDNKISIDNPDDINILLKMSETHNSSLRTNIWTAFSRSKVLQKEEERLLMALKSSSTRTEIEEIAATLQRIGTKKSLPTLREMMYNYKNQECLMPVVKAIRDIGGKEEVPFLIEQLDFQTNSFLKKSISEKLADLGDERAILILIKRVKQILLKKRKQNWHYAPGQLPELVNILILLKAKGKSEQKEVSKLFIWIKSKKIDFLKPEELNWVNENI